MKAKVNKVTIHAVHDDILLLDIDGLVNATQSNLAISPELATKAGPALQRACAEIGWCEVGSAVITNAGNLPVKKVIHAVGPRWGEGSERGKLANATWESLRLAELNQLRAIALPAISIGTSGYPLENCAKTMLKEIIDFTFEPLRFVRIITICLANQLELEAFQQELQEQLDTLKETGEGRVRI